MSLLELRPVVLAAWVIGQGFLADGAQAGVGDLDPAFHDHGRISRIPDVQGEVRSIVATDSGGFVVGVGDLDFTGGADETECGVGSSYGKRFAADGTIDQSFDATRTSTVEFFDLATQPDGTFVAIGRKVKSSNFGGRCFNFSSYVVFRLGAKGRLDTAFGTLGFVDLGVGAGFRLGGTERNDRLGLHSLVVDPDGRIVVAGMSSSAGSLLAGTQLVVQRLLGDGTPDSGFGDGGVYVGSAGDYRDSPKIVRTSDGGYRITHTRSGSCSIVGLTDAGVPDSSFGDSGVAVVSSVTGAPVDCNAMAEEADDSLLLAGASEGRAFVGRLLPTGAVDATFVADASIAGTMRAITAVALAADGKILIAGTGPDGAAISRLTGDGSLDTQFGEEGRTYVRLRTTASSSPKIRSMIVRPDGSVVAGGGDESRDRPFVVQLLGDAGGEARGVISFTTSGVIPAESDGEAILQVRRYGGSDGSVSADYRTVASAEATAGTDFTMTSGTLHWTDGDTSERQIAVGLIADPGLVEAPERFRVVLESPPDGAGLGTRAASVRIQPDGSPAGQLQIDTSHSDFSASENGVAQIRVRRDYYYTGRVCVTLTPQSGSASSEDDFSAAPKHVCWKDQDDNVKLVTIEIVDDTQDESIEEFVVELSNPTGGAVLGHTASARVKLHDND